jgi:hypothetical protein
LPCLNYKTGIGGKTLKLQNRDPRERLSGKIKGSFFKFKNGLSKMGGQGVNKVDTTLNIGIG